MAYTAETELYGGLNLTMRTKGGLQEKKLVVYGEYIYHLSEAICACQNYVGKVCVACSRVEIFFFLAAQRLGRRLQSYRGMGAVLKAGLYAPGTTITWQQFSSATRKQSVASK